MSWSVVKERSRLKRLLVNVRVSSAVHPRTSKIALKKPNSKPESEKPFIFIQDKIRQTKKLTPVSLPKLRFTEKKDPPDGGSS